MSPKKPMPNFRDMVYNMPNENRLKILNYCAKYGNPNDVLKSMFEIQPCYVNKKIEVRIKP